MRTIHAVLFIVFSLQNSISYAEDWSSCADELDNLRRAASYASDAAQSAESARYDYESKKDELENCNNYPDIYDLYGDRCESLRWDYESAKSNYQSELSTLESELSGVGSKIRWVESSCAVDFSPGISSPRGTKSKSNSDPDCSVFQQYKGKLPDEILLETCKKSMNEEKCKKCINVK